jgi:hypothetical protein
VVLIPSESLAGLPAQDELSTCCQPPFTGKLWVSAESLMSELLALATLAW